MQERVYKIARVAARIGVLLIALTSFLSVFIVGLTQYKPFRQWAIDKALVALNSSLMGDVSVGDVEGNLITGLELSDAVLETDGSRMITVPRIEINYRLAPLLKSRTIQASAILHTPEVLLRRDDSGVWNFEKIVPVSDEPPGPPQPLDWVFDIRHVEIRDGTLTIVDATSVATASTAEFNPLNSRLTQLNAAFGVLISEESQLFNVEHISFNIPDRGFQLVDLATRITSDRSGVSIDRLRLESASNFIQISGSIDSVGLFDSAFAQNIEALPFSLELEADRFDIDELKQLIPGISDLSGAGRLRLAAKGTIDEIRVNELDLDLADSRIRGEARLTHISSSKDYRIDAQIENSRIVTRDLSRYIPDLLLPDIELTRDVSIDRASFVATASSISGLIRARNRLGQIEGGAWLSMDDRPAWRVDLALKELDVGRMLLQESFGGPVNLRVVAAGEGLDRDALSARVRIVGGRSRAGQRSIGALFLDASYTDGGVVSLDTMIVGWGDPGSGVTLPTATDRELFRVLDPERRYSTQESFVRRLSRPAAVDAFVNAHPSVRMGGWLDLKSLENPKYSFALQSDRVDISRITLDSEHRSRLGFDLTLEGSGVEPNDLTGRAVLKVHDALLPNGVELEPFSADVRLEETADGRLLSLVSDLVDLRVEGTWDYNRLISTLSGASDKLVNYVLRKQRYGDDLFAMTEQSDESHEPIFAQYSITPKDLTLLKAFIPDVDLDVDASLHGTISGTGTILGITTRGTIDRFSYETDGQRFSAAAVDLDAEIRNISTGSMDELLDASIHVSTDSLIRFGEQELELRGLNVRFSEGTLSANGAGVLDREYLLEFDADVNVEAEAGYVLTADTLVFGLPRGLQWHNIAPVEIVLSENLVDVRSFRMSRPSAEVIDVEGTIVDFNEFRDVSVSATGMSLDKIRPFVQDAKTLEMIEDIAGNLREIQLDIDGPFSNPAADISASIGSMSYDEISIGDLELDLSYRNQNVSGTAQIIRPFDPDTEVQPVLLDVDINSLPVDMSLGDSGPLRLPENGRVDVTARASKLPLAIVGPFATGIGIERGVADSLFLRLSGPYSDLTYTGSGEIADGLVRVESTNVPYEVEGQFTFREDDLQIDGVRLSNVPTDHPKGVGYASGRITFDGFTPEVFAINLRTGPDGLLVLSDATQAVNDEYYGDVVIRANRANNEVLTFGGTYDEPTLTGSLTVLSSDLTYPLKEYTAEFEDRVEYISYEDWKRRHGRKQGFWISDSIKKANDIPVADTGRPDTTDPQRDDLLYRETFADRLNIDLDLSIDQRAKVRVQLGVLQELLLVLDNAEQPLRFSQKGRDMSLRGEVRLVEGSEFIFIKKFEATGTVNFQGDIENPGFDIKGTYRGRRTVNNETQPYAVTVALTGTRDKPMIRFDYSIAGVPSTDDEEQRRLDAVLLLVFGRRSTENLGSDLEQNVQDVVSEATDVGATALGGVINQALGDIQGIDIALDLGQRADPGQVRIVVTGRLGPATVRYSGKVSSPVIGSESSIEFPLFFDFLVGGVDYEVIDTYELNSSRTSLTTSEGEVVRPHVRFRYTW